MDVLVIDIPNRFIQMCVKEKKYMAIIKLRGVLVDILCVVFSDYKSYVTRDKRGDKQLLLHCQNSPVCSTIASLPRLSQA